MPSLADTRRAYYLSLLGYPSNTTLSDADLESLVNSGSGFKVPAFKAGYWYSPVGNGTGTGQISNNSQRLIPVVFSHLTKLSGFAAEFTVAGDVGSTFRVSIYDDDGSGMPKDLKYNLGSVTADAVGTKIGACDVTLKPGMYWLAGCVLGAPVTAPTMRTVTNLNLDFPVPLTNVDGALFANIPAGGLGNSTNTGGAAPPTPIAPGSLSAVATLPRILIKVG